MPSSPACPQCTLSFRRRERRERRDAGTLTVFPALLEGEEVPERGKGKGAEKVPSKKKKKKKSEGTPNGGLYEKIGAVLEVVWREVYAKTGLHLYVRRRDSLQRL